MNLIKLLQNSLLLMYLFLPLKTIYILLNFILTVVLIMYEILIKKKKVKIDAILLIFYFLIIQLLFFIIYKNDISSNIKEILRFLYYSTIIILFSINSMTLKDIIGICKVCISINLCIQGIQFFKLFDINKFIAIFYGDGDIMTPHLTLTFSNNISEFRSGSIYINPNVYAILACFMLLVFFFNIYINKEKRGYIWIAIAFISILLTNSRTGIIFAVLILVYYILKLYKGKWRSKILLILNILFLLVLSLEKDINIADIRALNIISDFSTKGSMGTKIGILNSYLQQISAIDLVFGSSPALDLQLDAEISYFIAWYGILGSFWYFFLILLILKRSTKRKKMFFFPLAVLFLCAGVSNSLIVNFALFPFIIASLFVIDKFKINER